jgi:hypothetical protein
LSVRLSKNIKSKVWQFIFLEIGLLREISRVATMPTKMMFYHQRGRIINLFKENEQTEKKTKKLARL